ncbi:hypothetical protein T484DRAFT_1928803, partial [Baffinella frigidus]
MGAPLTPCPRHSLSAALSPPLTLRHSRFAAHSPALTLCHSLFASFISHIRVVRGLHALHRHVVLGHLAAEGREHLRARQALLVVPGPLGREDAGNAGSCVREAARGAPVRQRSRGRLEPLQRPPIHVEVVR